MKIDGDHQLQCDLGIGRLPVYDINSCRPIGMERDIDHTSYEKEDTISMSDTYMLGISVRDNSPCLDFTRR